MAGQFDHETKHQTFAIKIGQRALKWHRMQPRQDLAQRQGPRQGAMPDPRFQQRQQFFQPVLQILRPQIEKAGRDQQARHAVALPHRFAKADRRILTQRRNLRDALARMNMLLTRDLPARCPLEQGRDPDAARRDRHHVQCGRQFQIAIKALQPATKGLAQVAPRRHRPVARRRLRGVAERAGDLVIQHVAQGDRRPGAVVDDDIAIGRAIGREVFHVGLRNYGKDFGD